MASAHDVLVPEVHQTLPFVMFVPFPDELSSNETGRKVMQIGELSKTTGVSVRSLRHYEKKGLLESHRAENGYRVFRSDSVERVEYIQLFLSCGFGTREIARFLPCYVKGAGFDRQSCPAGYRSPWRRA